MKYTEIFKDGFFGYANYLKNEVFNPHWGNYFYWLIAISAVIYVLELLFPWRKNQAPIREDFWLDTFYMFFNFFLFGLIGFAAVSDVFVAVFNDFLWNFFGKQNLVAVSVKDWPRWSQLLLLFLVRDFVQWNVHRLLHRVPVLWEFHKVHHSVREMGFAAHLRYHFMENIIYKSLEYIPLAMIGFGLRDFIIVHLFTIVVGHLNHANIYVPLGPLKYIFNNPQMHIWHHAKDLPQGKYGINYGLTLSVWDYLFGTAHIPHDGRDIKLGFEGVDEYSHNFFEQTKKPFVG
jgi:sterol desaturase/sphingolipid hydroxylase (fatty acid hydroxylase superfamily)